VESAHLVEYIRQKMAEVEASYRRQSAGSSFCQIQKDGRVSGGLKYEEGRLVALQWVLRTLQKQGDAGFSVIAAERDYWLKALADVQAKSPPPILWVAYRQGGVDALTWVVELIQAEKSFPDQSNEI
jgi:hypothetical protein